MYHLEEVERMKMQFKKVEEENDSWNNEYNRVIQVFNNVMQTFFDNSLNKVVLSYPEVNMRL